jgi:[ribosomal protein S5]-alanine N-acetyltransferase
VGDAITSCKINVMEILISTERLIIRALTKEDVNGIYELDTDPEVHRYLGNNPITSIEQAKDVITFIQKQYVENGIGRWAIIEKSSNNFVGWTGLKLIKDIVNNHTNYYDLGYRLQKKYWGKGYATETAAAVLDYAFTKMAVTEIFGIVDVENIGSNNVLKKLGLQFVEIFMYENTKHHWYKITKEEWENKQQL